MMLCFASSVFEEVSNRPEVLLYAATATATAVLATGLVVNNSLQSHGKDAKRQPPRVTGWPIIGSAIEFGVDCRAFLKKYFSKTKSPIFTTNVLGQDYHFVDTSYPGFAPEIVFRQAKLSFHPIANDAVVHGFGFPRYLLDAMRVTVHTVRSAGLSELMAQAYQQFERIVFSDPSLYPTDGSSTKPLFWLVKESLFRATIGSVVSDSIVAKDPSSNLKAFEDYDDKIPLLISKMPIWLFSKAKEGRRVLIDACKGDDFYASLSQVVRKRNELVAEERYGITSQEDIALLTHTMVWAAVANTLPSGFWLLYSLLRNRDTAYAAIQKEIRDFYRGRTKPFEAPLTVEEIDTMKGLDSALTETFRIYSESLIARDVMKDFELDLKIDNDDNGSSSTAPHKYFLRKGSRVAVMMSCLHMDESVFADAHSFRWDRFLPDPVTGKPQKFTKHGKPIPVPVRPYGGGVSLCPGRKFASYEIKAFVVELLKRYDLELVDPGEAALPINPARAGLGMNVPVGDVEVRITKL